MVNALKVVITKHKRREGGDDAGVGAGGDASGARRATRAAPPLPSPLSGRAAAAGGRQRGAAEKCSACKGRTKG